MKGTLNMKELRQRAGVTAQAVATELGIATSTVSNWDQGRTEPKLKLGQVQQLCELYKCSLEDLVAAIAQH